MCLLLFIRYVLGKMLVQFVFIRKDINEINNLPITTNGSYFIIKMTEIFFVISNFKNRFFFIRKKPILITHAQA